MTRMFSLAAKAALACLLATVSLHARAVDESQLLPVDQAFALQAKATAADRIELTWKIAPGYYLYRHRASVEGLEGGSLAMPDGKKKHDEFFGDVEIYRESLTATYTGVPAAGAQTVALKVKYQGCADVGVCYPPQTRMLDVALPVANAGGDALFGERNAGPALIGAMSADGTVGEPLPPEQAFQVEAIADGGNGLLLRFTPAQGYYLYRDKTHLRYAAGDGITLGAPRWPEGRRHRDAYFGEVVVYFDQVEVPVPVGRTHARPVDGTLSVTFQGCQEGGICYPEMTRAIPVSLPAGAPIEVAPAPAADDAAPLAEDQRLALSLAGKERAWQLVLFFVYGIALAFTPCVLPMVPILSGLIAGRGGRIGAWRGFSLSTVYVLASAVVFTIAGVLAGLLGAAANLQVWMQNPWVLGAFALLFVVLSLSMFGLYELQLPAGLRARLGEASDRQHGGSWMGVAAMGALSALIVGPCVAPPLMGAVLYIAQTRDPLLGGAALFLLALGMGAPLIAFGIAAGKGMPTSGPWMVAVQRVFGFVFLGLAIWMLSRVLPAPATVGLWGMLAIGAAVWAFGIGRTPVTRFAARFASILFFLMGTAQLLGAFAGAHDPLQPLAGVIGEKPHTTVKFERIKSVEDLDRALADARTAGKPVMLDFYADWCVSCKEMEKYTFTDQKVMDALAGYVLLQADVTANDAQDQALMQRFGIIGPPMSLFFFDGVERRGLRLVGFEAADKFVERAHKGAAK